MSSVGFFVKPGQNSDPTQPDYKLRKLPKKKKTLLNIYIYKP